MFASILLASALLSQQPASSAQTTQQTAPESHAGIPEIRVNVRLVNVFVNVADATGAPVGGLSRENFALSEDGRPQKIAVFERESEMPLSIVLAMDTSGSVRSDLHLEQEAAKHFLHALLRPQDELQLLQFSYNVDELVPFTNNLKRIDSGLGRLRPGTSTALYNAVYLASQSLAARPNTVPRRKVIVLITDGGDTMDGTTYQQAEEQALRAQAMIYSLIIVPVDADAGRDTGGEHALIQLSEDTGGKYYYVEDPRDMEKTFGKLSEDLRTQYLLGYYPTRRLVDEDDFRKITVQMTDEKLRGQYQLRYRNGYYPNVR
ncbi:MAG: VWA domain-containing protein [Acidobacteriaceae bacterium]